MKREKIRKNSEIKSRVKVKYQRSFYPQAIRTPGTLRDKIAVILVHM